MAHGIYRDRTFVYVDYGGGTIVPISHALYRDRKYDPPLNQLPTKEKYEALTGRSE
jgi:hypothetical protein